MLRVIQSNNAQLLNLTVFHSFLTYLCKSSFPCCVSTVALVSTSFAVIFPQHFTLQHSQLNLLHLFLNSCIGTHCLKTWVWLGLVQWKVAKNFSVVEWQYPNAEWIILKLNHV